MLFMKVGIYCYSILVMIPLIKLADENKTVTT